MMAYTYWVCTSTRGSYKEMHRILKVSYTPIHSHYTETMNGNSTIRAFRSDKYAIDKNLELYNERNLAMDMSVSCLIWYSIQMRLSASILMFVAGVLCVMNRSTVDPVTIAMAFQYIMDLGEVYCCLVHC